MALLKNRRSESVRSSLDSPSEDEKRDDGLHLEIDRDKLEPLTKPGISGHQWVQRGPFLVCKSCPIEHGVWIGVDKILVGINKQGNPILKRVDIRRSKKVA